MTRLSGDWLQAPATQAVLSALDAAGYQALFVGGCVRNALLDVPVNDIDIATDAHPDVVMKVMRDAGLHAVATGIEHGTITVVSDHIPHEVTTFRSDIETDGRRAVVAFSSDITDDASRRDFTMNALYARRDGTVVDPLGGLADLRARRVRFINDATLRIREDYLRILRYFRFLAYYANPEDGTDPEALAAIATSLDGLDGLSRERVGVELLKLLAASDPAPAVAAMRSVGVLPRILTGSEDRALAPLIHLEAQIDVGPNPLRRLAALGGVDIAKSLRLSRRDAKQLALLRDLTGGPQGSAELGYRYGAAAGCDVLLLRAAILESPLVADMSAALATGAAASFPVSAQDLMPQAQGAELGTALKKLEDLWIASGFTLDRNNLMALL